MLQYFLLQLISIGFEKQIEKYQSKQHMHLKTLTFVFILTLFLYFYFSLSFTKFVNAFLGREEDEDEDGDEEIKKENEEQKNDDKENLINKHKEVEEGKIDEEQKDKTDEIKIEEQKKEYPKKKEFMSKISNEILNGTYGILIFNGVYSLIFSAFYLSEMSSDFKHLIFEDNINIIYIPILMNKFYYFTLNYYCTYTSESYKGFELISSSTLISLFIQIWNLIISLIKSSIPDKENDDDNNDYYKILYITQIVFASIPSLVVAIALIIGFIESFSECIMDGCDWSYFKLHRFLFCLTSFFLCFGGLWLKLEPTNCELSTDCCCDCYFIGSNLFCDECCFCDESSDCYSECCENNINGCDLCCLCQSCCGCDCCTLCDVCCMMILLRNLNKNK